VANVPVLGGIINLTNAPGNLGIKIGQSINNNGSQQPSARTSGGKAS
jgi:hypothetical protein